MNEPNPEYTSCAYEAADWLSETAKDNHGLTWRLREIDHDLAGFSAEHNGRIYNVTLMEIGRAGEEPIVADLHLNAAEMLWRMKSDPELLALVVRCLNQGMQDEWDCNLLDALYKHGLSDKELSLAARAACGHLPAKGEGKQPQPPTSPDAGYSSGSGIPIHGNEYLHG
jgi:hypothetical protein